MIGYTSKLFDLSFRFCVFKLYKCTFRAPLPQSMEVWTTYDGRDLSMKQAVIFDLKDLTKEPLQSLIQHVSFYKKNKL